MIYSSSTIQTFTGKVFDVFNPDPDLICVEDIAHALSNQCRFTGHVQAFYSVAQHSVLVSDLAMDFPLYGLLHDASEAYLTDVASPIKHHPEFEFYRKVEAKLQDVIYRRFGLYPVTPPSVKEADGMALRMEAQQMMGPLKVDGDWNSGPVKKELIMPLHSTIAEKLFLRAFKALEEKDGRN